MSGESEEKPSEEKPSEERLSESGDLATEGEQNSVTTPIEDIVARSRQERDESLGIDPEVEEVIVDSEASESDEILDMSDSDVDKNSDNSENLEGEDNLEDEKVDKGAKQASNFIVERDGEQYLLTTVGGVRKEVPLSEAQAIVQKNTNAELQTTIAVQKQRHYEDLSRDLKQRQESTQSDDTPDAAIDQKALNNGFKEMYEGDYDKGTAAVVEVLNKAIAGSKAQKFTTADISQVVNETLQTRELGSAYNRFSKKPKYQALLVDQYLKQRIDQETEKLTNNPFFMDGKPSFDQIFEAAGDAVIDWANSALESSLGGSNTETELKPVVNTPLDKQLKVARKRAHRSSVKAAAARRIAPVELPSKTNSDIISELAKGRGQNILS